jgi:hypothetical protein
MKENAPVDRIRLRCFILISGALLFTLLTGCLQSYARFSRDDQVYRSFTVGEVPPELNYFYAGPKDNPHAMMGIDPDLTVRSNLWVAFEPEPAQLKKMSANIYGEDRREPDGFTILSNEGEFIGIWFSSLHFPGVKLDQENNTVMVPYSGPAIYNLH